MACYSPHSEDLFYDAEPSDDVYTTDYEAKLTDAITREREAVKQIFTQLHGILTIREGELLSMLEAVGQKIGRAITERQRQLDQLRQTLNELSHSLSDNHMLSTLHETQKPVLKRISEIGDQCEKICKIGIKVNIEALQVAIQEFGEVEYEYEEERSCSHLEKVNSISIEEATGMYKNRNNPVWVSDIPTETSFIMKSGLIPTRQLAINHTSDMVAIADKTQESVHVFTQDGNFIKSVKPDIGPPLGVVFACNHLFVTSSGVLAKISTDEWVVKNVHNENNFTFSVLDSWKSNVYACLPDNTGIAIFCGEDLAYRGVVSLQIENVNQDRVISDFKVVGNSFYVLFSHSDGWLSEFSLFKSDEYPLQEYSNEGEHIRNIANGDILRAPAYFCFDDYSNILVTSIGTFHDGIMILYENGQEIGSVGTFWLYGLLQPTKTICNPTGVAYSSKGKILVACTFTNYPVLQAY